METPIKGFLISERIRGFLFVLNSLLLSAILVMKYPPYWRARFDPKRAHLPMEVHGVDSLWGSLRMRSLYNGYIISRLNLPR